ncbi:glycosyltransferase family 4 protein, partial [Candidatus Sumerlaeota bacterium]|nr:glycosyltransferase family 4 protein [Candidatus Sumerlaeota bacterium]
MVPRKIALITPSVRLLGARRSLLALVKALDTARFVPIVVCPRRGDLQELLVENRIPTHTHALPPWRKVRYWPVIPSHIRRLSRWAEGLGISLLHANEAHSAPYAIRVGQRLGIPTISHIRLPVTERMIRNYELRHADRVVAVSHAVAEAFRSWPDCEKRVRVIYNGLDVEQWRRAAGDIAAARRGIRQRLGLAPDAFLIGQVGLIGQRKQQHLFVEAARRMASRPSSPQAAPKANCHFLIVGNPSPGETAYSRQLAQAIESAGLSRQITIWPFERQIEPI